MEIAEVDGGAGLSIRCHVDAYNDIHWISLVFFWLFDQSFFIDFSLVLKKKGFIIMLTRGSFFLFGLIISTVLFYDHVTSIFLQPSSQETQHWEESAVSIRDSGFNQSFPKVRLIKRNPYIKHGRDKRSYKQAAIRGQAALAKLECGLRERKDQSEFQDINDLQKYSWREKMKAENHIEKLDKELLSSLSGVNSEEETPASVDVYRIKMEWPDPEEPYLTAAEYSNQFSIDYGAIFAKNNHAPDPEKKKSFLLYGFITGQMSYGLNGSSIVTNFKNLQIHSRQYIELMLPKQCLHTTL